MAPIPLATGISQGIAFANRHADDRAKSVAANLHDFGDSHWGLKDREEGDLRPPRAGAKRNPSRVTVACRSVLAGRPGQRQCHPFTCNFRTETNRMRCCLRTRALLQGEK